MAYTIKEAAEKVNLTVHTLRFYDKEGLLPFVSRDGAGNRIFTESDLEWLRLICCLKNTGMPIKQIGVYIQWCMQGDSSLEARRELLIEHRQAVIEQIKELSHNLEAINYKIEHYNTLCNPRVEVKPAIPLARELEVEAE
jgi:DNA-binding transcriptional MerR regulator